MNPNKAVSFIIGYYKAAALTTDKMLQEHQEVNVSSKLRGISLARINLESKEFHDNDIFSL